MLELQYQNMGRSARAEIYILNEIYFLHLTKHFIFHEMVSMVEGESDFADADIFIAPPPPHEAIKEDIRSTDEEGDHQQQKKKHRQLITAAITI